MASALRERLGGAVDANPRLTRRREWQGMSLAEKEARGRRFVNQTWRAVAPLYGGGAMPEVTVAPGVGANRTEMVGGQPRVELSRTELLNLARPKFEMPKARADSRELLMHEFAHAHQNPALLSDSAEGYAHREEAAQLFATYWAHRLFGADPMEAGGPLPYDNRRAASRDLASAYGAGYWRHGQFAP